MFAFLNSQIIVYYSFVIKAFGRRCTLKFDSFFKWNSNVHVWYEWIFWNFAARLTAAAFTRRFLVSKSCLRAWRKTSNYIGKLVSEAVFRLFSLFVSESQIKSTRRRKRKRRERRRLLAIRQAPRTRNGLSDMLLFLYRILQWALFWVR